MLTAFRDFEYAQTALNLGVCRYLLKPSKMDELNEAIHAMIARLDALPKQQAPETTEPANPAGNYIVRQALDYMKAHCAERLSLGDVADQVYVSQWHLSKLINRHTNQSFLDILGGMRVEKARQLLAGSTLRIHEVAEQCGYSDLGHFSRSFKKLTGLTPGEYRDTAVHRSEG